LLFAGRLQVATIDGEPVGYSAFSHRGRDGHLARLAVHPDWQGQGLGHLLLADVLQAAKAAGVQQVMLNTQVDNQRGQHLYRAYGFRPTGEVVPVLGKLIRSSTWNR
ncbi:MAG: GNAT family N-acetyltransferase, partial [Caldilineaceae bacterium]|nr:GNAT family N-acetyltransferase [Caldilineaceae bacterium]